MKKSCLFALVQHPMVLLINEDRGIPEIGERVPEWGAPDIETYVQRIRRNLETLRKHPDLRLNYEFSAVELKIINEHTSDIIPEIRRFVQKGQLAFVGGDFSQAHGQLYSGELNFRQLEKGMKVFEDLVGYKVNNNFHQETCVYDQLPQLMDAFGFLTASPPVFPHHIQPLLDSGQPHFVYTEKTGYVPLASDAVAVWRGLDGTEIPILIAGVSIGGFNNDRVQMEIQKGLYRSSNILITAPDMEEIDEECYTFIKMTGKTVLLDDALLHEVKTHKPTWKLKLSTYWSYSEGQMAEAVYRKIRETESMLLSEETQTAVLGTPKREDFDTDIETLLTAMHHDIHWMEVTDLKYKYIAKMEDIIRRSQKYMASLINGDTEIHSNGLIEVVNTLPYDRDEYVRFTMPGNSSAKIIDTNGLEIPSICVPSWRRNSHTDIFFIACVPSLSTKKFSVVADGKGHAFGIKCSQAMVNAGDGTYIIESICTVSKALLLENNLLTGHGHDLKYIDGKGNIVGGSTRYGTMMHYEGKNIEVLRISAPIGDIPTEIEFVASARNKFLSISTRLRFDNNEIGVMWEDWTKLNSYWPVAGDKIRHDVPYGVSDGIETVPIYAPGWISVKGKNGGLVVMNKGTPKHFVENGTIGLVWAWGSRTFSNRTHLSWLNKNEYDLSLKGIQIIDTGISVCSSGMSEADITRLAQCYNTPMYAYKIEKKSQCTPGSLQRSMPDMSRTGLVVTAIQNINGQMAFRFYESEGKVHSVEKLCKETGYSLLVTDLKNAKLDKVTPYRIGYIYFIA